MTLDAGPGWVLPDDQAPVPGRRSRGWRCCPSLDPTTMGWKERDWYLGDHGPALYDYNGNAGPTVWVDGRIVGGWAQRPTGEVVYGCSRTSVAPRRPPCPAPAADLETWLGGGARQAAVPDPVAEAAGTVTYQALMTCSRSNALQVESLG